LKKGSKGEKVKELQRALLSIDPAALPKYGVDGDFGSETEAAVQKYLGKKSVDSQEDLNKILSIKSTQAAQALVAAANANRSKLATTLVNAYKSNPANLDFYAIWDTQVSTGVVTSDGRMVGSTTVVKTKGQKLPLTRNAKFTITANGWIQAVDGTNYYYFSPYGFEVK
jgi:peptidoglycan hydrolase-like protein with peptidoglycan-binding domain